MAKFKYNKGEWSEFYAFLKLLSDGRLNLENEKENIFFPVLKIFKKSEFLEYLLSGEKVEVFVNGKFVKTLDILVVSKFADNVFKAIKNNDGVFEVCGVNELMEYLHCENVKESKSKFDILLELHDIFSGFDRICGFSIKSDLGSPPTLLNASGATKFVYEICGLSEERICEISNLSHISKSWIIDSVNQIYAFGGEFKFVRTENENFADNLTLIDTKMDEILANLLLKAYANREKRCEFLLELLEKENPLRFKKRSFYIYKFKKLLIASALGMKPSVLWDGVDEANGGYIVVKKSGEVVGYHLYNRNCFEDYLFKNTTISTPSTSRYDYAKIYEKDGQFFFDLVLQIRFV